MICERPRQAARSVTASSSGVVVRRPPGFESAWCLPCLRSRASFSGRSGISRAKGPDTHSVRKKNVICEQVFNSELDAETNKPANINALYLKLLNIAIWSLLYGIDSINCTVNGPAHESELGPKKAY